MAAATVEDVQLRGMMAYRNSDDLSRVRGQQWVGAYQNSGSSENDSGCLLWWWATSRCPGDQPCTWARARVGGTMGSEVL
jgi:hypothetical protein